MQKLSAAQEKAMEKLTNEWQSSFVLEVGHNTLDALVRKDLVQKITGPGIEPVAKYRLKPQYPEGAIESDMRLTINEPGKCKDFGIRFGTIQAETINRFDNERTEITVKGDSIKVTICIDTEKLLDALEAGGLEAIIGEQTRKNIDDNSDGG